MSKKKILYILLALGIILIGAGVWLMYNFTTDDTPESKPVAISLSQGKPVVYEQATYFMRGENYELYIYDSGSILYIQEKGLRIPIKGHPATRTWSTGNLTVEQLNSLLAYLENSGLDKLEDNYVFPGESDGGTMSDLNLTLMVNSQNLNKKVTAFGYLSPDKDETYPDMPFPLNEIYEKLRTITKATENVASENIE